MTGTSEEESQKRGPTANEKILLYLKDFTSYREKGEVPLAVTQKEIAEGVKMLPSHVPRAIKKLKENSLIIEKNEHIIGVGRKLKAYFLTDKGTRVTESLVEELCSRPVRVRMHDGKVAAIPLSEVNMHLKQKIPLLQLIHHCAQDEILDLRKLDGGYRIIDFTKQALKVPLFLDRETELAELRRYIDMQEGKTIIVYGPVGIGKTALVSKLVDLYKPRASIFWYQLEEGTFVDDIMESLAEFFSLMGSDALKVHAEKGGNFVGAIDILKDTLDGNPTIFVFDNYFEVQEDVVEFFSRLVDAVAKIKKVKLIFTARENVPFYNWFHTWKDVERGAVIVFHIKGLAEEDGKTLLGAADIDAKAYKQIHQLAIGSPRFIQMIKDGDAKALKDSGRFTKEEIRLLMFLRTLKK